MIVRRIAAFAVDYLVLAVYIALLSVTFALLPRDSTQRLFATQLSGQVTAFIVLTAPVWLYFAVLESSRQQATFGKRALRLRVVDTAGHRISLPRALLRNGLKLIPWELAHTCLWRIEGWPTAPEQPTGLLLVGLILVWVIIAIYFIWMFIDDQRRSLYDILSGTAVKRVS